MINPTKLIDNLTVQLNPLNSEQITVFTSTNTNKLQKLKKQQLYQKCRKYIADVKLNSEMRNGRNILWILIDMYLVNVTVLQTLVNESFSVV